MKLHALIILFVLISVSSEAHEGKHEKKISKIDTLTIAGKDTIAINGKLLSKTDGKIKEERNAQHFELNPLKQIFEHPHNKLIHFPIVLGLVAFIFSLLNRKNNNYEKPVLALVSTGFIFSLASVLTGLNQITPFMGTEKEWIVDYHRFAGILLFVSYSLWTLSLSAKYFRKYDWIFGLAVVLLIVVTAFLGGVLAH